MVANMVAVQWLFVRRRGWEEDEWVVLAWWRWACLVVVKVDLCSDCLFVASWSRGVIQSLLDLNDFHSFLRQFQVGAIFFGACIFKLVPLSYDACKIFIFFDRNVGTYYFSKRINLCFNLLLLWWIFLCTMFLCMEKMEGWPWWLTKGKRRREDCGCVWM